MVLEHTHQLITVEEVKNYLFAGNSKVTLKSLITGKHFTYKIKASENDSKNPLYFVTIMFGPDSFTYIGYLRFNKAYEKYVFIAKKGYEGSLSVKVIDFLKNQVNKNVMHEDLQILKSNTCCKCGKNLTTPESIADGIGPECKKILSKKGRW